MEGMEDFIQKGLSVAKAQHRPKSGNDTRLPDSYAGFRILRSCGTKYQLSVLSPNAWPAPQKTFESFIKMKAGDF